MENNINFVAIPRCASNSIQKALDGTVNPHHDSIRKTKDERFSFAVIRNPLDRLMSWWRYHQGIQYDESIRSIYERPFKDWAMIGCPHHWSFDDLIRHQITNPLKQYDFVCDPFGNVKVDQLIKFDDIEENGGFKLEPHNQFIQLEQLNASNPTKHAGLDRACVKKIHSQFELDYKLYNSL